METSDHLSVAGEERDLQESETATIRPSQVAGGSIVTKQLRFVELLAVGVAAIGSIAAPLHGSPVTVDDVGLESGFQDIGFGRLKHGRTSVAADFDGDGRTDFFIGNPGDESFILRNTTLAGELPSFEQEQVLLIGDVAWGGAAADFDNDGDYDLFVAIGGKEGIGYDRLFRNDWIESGEARLTFTDVSSAAGIRGPVPPGFTDPIETASTNGVWVDYDRDGDVDLFVSTGDTPWSLPTLRTRNTLWRNEGDGTFTDVTDASGLATSRCQTQHSTFFDIDNDGDSDLFESNDGYPNVLWRNRLVESGSASFEDVTALFSPAGEDLSYPTAAFASAAADFNNDGWEDLIVFERAGPGPGSPYPGGHAIFENRAGIGFENVSELTGMNDTYQALGGVMGCQVGDVNGDGVPDVYIGNGGMDSPTRDQLYLSDSPIGVTPHYIDRTDLIDFPADEAPLSEPYPPYPYRTHGTSIVDVDGDGTPEIAVTNGGPWFTEQVEPNRLFRFRWDPSPGFLLVRPVGDGMRVSTDAIGTRFALTVERSGAPPWTIYKTLYSGSAFSAQNGFDVHFGLADADSILSLEIIWPDGWREVIDSGISVNRTVVVMRDPASGVIPPTLKLTESNGEVAMTWEASCASTDFDYAVYGGRIDDGFTLHEPLLCTTGGTHTATLPTPAASTYYLVVPRNLQREGSYGRSGSTERPAAAAPCLEQSLSCSSD